MSTPRTARPSGRALIPGVLAVAGLLLSGCGGGKGSSGSELKVTGTVTASGTGQQQKASITMTDDLTFSPNVVKATVGSLALTVENVGRIPHNLVFSDGSKGALPTVKGKGTATLTVPFGKAGTYRFTCTFHSGMDGQVVVSG
jgi:plastocyanin